MPVLVLLFLFILPAWGGAETVNLEEALRAATERRPGVRADRYRAEAAEASVREARSRFLPRVHLSENFLWTDEPARSLFISLNQEELVLAQDADYYNFAPSRKDFETRLTVEQPLFEPDLYYGWRRAEAGAAAAEAGARWSVEEAAFEAFRAYLEVQQAHAALDWAASSIRESEEILRLGRERYEAGTGLKADYLRARVFRAEAVRRKISAENDLAIARRRLGLVTGRDEPVDIASPLRVQRLEETPGPAEFHREDLRALGFLEKEASLASDQSRAAWLPRLGLTASYSLHDSGAPFGTDAGSWAVGAGLTWEIFNGFGRRHASVRAEALVRAAEENRLESWRQARFRLDEAKSRVEEAGARLGSAREAADLAEESHRLMMQRYQAGLVNLSDQLAAQAELDRARFDMVTAESLYLLATGNILFQKGVFTETLLSDFKEIPR